MQEEKFFKPDFADVQKTRHEGLDLFAGKESLFVQKTLADTLRSEVNPWLEAHRHDAHLIDYLEKIYESKDYSKAMFIAKSLVPLLAGNSIDLEQKRRIVVKWSLAFYCLHKYTEALDFSNKFSESDIAQLSVEDQKGLWLLKAIITFDTNVSSYYHEVTEYSNKFLALFDGVYPQWSFQQVKSILYIQAFILRRSWAYDQAIDYLQESLKLDTPSSTTLGRDADIYLLFAEIFAEKKDYIKASSYAKKSRNLFPWKETKKVLDMIQSHIGKEPITQFSSPDYTSHETLN